MSDVPELKSTKTAVFLCWSGTRSQKVALALEKAMKSLGTYGLDPFCSPAIEKGGLWFERVRTQLERADAAIVCLTPENAKTAWVHFEAGVVAAKMAVKPNEQTHPRVYPLCFKMEADELTGPLSMFQATNGSEHDILSLIEQLIPTDKRHQFHEDVASDKTKKWLIEFEKDLHDAEYRPLEEILPDLESLFRRKTFDERLDDCVNQAWPARWNGARDTHVRLKEKVDEVGRQCRPYARELLQQLVEAVDSYAMALELLLNPLAFELKTDGKRDIPPGLLKASEQRRKEVKQLLAGLADPRQAPAFEESPTFQNLETFAAKKAMIHRFEGWLDRARKEKEWRLQKVTNDDSAQQSQWHFDRIAFYLARQQSKKKMSVVDTTEWLRVELEKVRAEGPDASHMPLTYCLRPLQSALDRVAAERTQEKVRPKEAQAILHYLGEAFQLGKDREEKEGAPSRLRCRAESLQLHPALSGPREENQ